MRRRNFLKWCSTAALSLSLADTSPSEQLQPIAQAPRTAASTNVIETEQLTQEFFDYARENKEGRQRFLSRFFAEYRQQLPHCKGIVYDPELVRVTEELERLGKEYGFTPPREPQSMIRIVAYPSPIPCIGRGLENSLYVGDGFFDAYNPMANTQRAIATLDDAASVLVDHEGQHAIDAYEGMQIGDIHVTHTDFPGPDYPRHFASAVKESRAYYRQLKRIGTHRNISPAFYAAAKHNGSQSIVNLSGHADHYANIHDKHLEKIARAQLKVFQDVNIIQLMGNRTIVDFTFLR